MQGVGENWPVESVEQQRSGGRCDVEVIFQKELSQEQAETELYAVKKLKVFETQIIHKLDSFEMTKIQMKKSMLYNLCLVKKMTKI